MTAPATEIQWSVSGISRAAADGRYVRRLVNGTLAADTFSAINSAAGVEPILRAASVFESGIPTDASPLVRASGDTARVAVRLKVVRLNGTPLIQSERINGTWQAPTQVLVNNVALALTSIAQDDIGGKQSLGGIFLSVRENVTTTAAGSQIEVQVNDVGSVANKALYIDRGGGANIAEVLARQATYRLIPQTTGQLRNPANTVSQIEWNATGVGFFGVAPIARPTVTGAKGGNAALTSLCTQLAALGLIIDSTT